MSSPGHDRDFVYVKGNPVRHTTAQRDWVCGECGGRLVMRWFSEPPNWRTVCVNHPDHAPDGFVHKSTWAYLESRRAQEAMEAVEVWKHLPAELREAIEA